MKLEILHKEFSKYLRYERQRTSRTIKTYEKNFSYFITWLGDNGYPATIESLTFMIIKDYMYFMRDCNLKPPTVRLRMVSLNSFLDFLVNWGYAEKNPIKGKLSFPKKSKPVNNYITLEEINRFLAVPEKLYRDTGKEKFYQGAVMLRAFLYTGMRRAGLISLDWENIDFEMNVLYVRLKGGEIKRFPIPEKLKNWFLPLREMRGLTTGPVFIGARARKRISETKLVEEFKYYYRLAGINRPFRIHDMRHRCATLLIENGMPVEQVKEVLGHKDINSTMIYIHQDVRKLKKGMDDAFKGLE